MVAEPREFNGKGHGPLKAVLRLRTLVISRSSELEKKRGKGPALTLTFWFSMKTIPS